MVTEIKPAIERFRASSDVWINMNHVFATYCGELFTGFYASEQEALDHCENSSDGEFGEQEKDEYKQLEPGDLFCVPGGDEIYLSNDKSEFVDSVASRCVLSFMVWGGEVKAPLAV